MPLIVKNTSSGRGIVNSLINKLPVELHIPGYNFCGPGTFLTKRLQRGDKGINLLDESCKRHDIMYSKHKDLNKRHEADKVLEEEAWERVKSPSAPLGEKISSWLITNTMKTKRKLGLGLGFPRKIRRRKHKKKKIISHIICN